MKINSLLDETSTNPRLGTVRIYEQTRKRKEQDIFD